MEIYLVIKDVMCGGCQEPLEVAAFKSKDVAKRYLNNLTKEVEVGDEWKVNSDDLSMEAYPEGEYSEDHISIYIKRVELV